MLYAKYMLSDGRIIKVFLGDALQIADGVDVNCCNDIINVIEYNSNNQESPESIDLKIINDESGTYFILEGEKVFVNNFMYYTLEQLNERLENNEPVSENDLIATLYKEKDRIVLYEKIQIPDAVLFGMRVYSSNKKDNTTYVLSKIVKDNFYNKYKWHYKIITVPLELEEQYYYGSNRHYTSSFLRYVENGDILIKDKKEFGLPEAAEKEMELKKLL